MNRIYKQVLVITALLFFVFGFSNPKAIAQYDNVVVSYNDFYEDLAPYGMWIDDPQYGYVWSPNVDGTFRPYYTNGYWVMTDYGNTWVSDYPWGWAAFHYGRWIYDSYYGWLWIPGTNWGPAWVSWREGQGYYGWAPLGPGYDLTGDYYCPNDWWVFIPPQYMYSGNYYRYWYGPHSNSQIINNTNFINNTYRNNNTTYLMGPRSHDIEQVTHQPVQVFHITNSNNLNTRVHNGMIKMYRPAEIRPAAAINGTRVSPPNVVRAPQPIRAPQSVNAGQNTAPQFRNDVPKDNGRTPTPGTNFNETAKPNPQPSRNDNNPYEWDVNRQQVKRDNYQKPEPAPQQQPRERQQPQPQRQQPQAQPQPQRQQPQPQPQPQRSQPAPAPQQQPRQAPQQQPRPAPAPQPAPRQVPAPAPRESGGRR